MTITNAGSGAFFFTTKQIFSNWRDASSNVLKLSKGGVDNSLSAERYSPTFISKNAKRPYALRQKRPISSPFRIKYLLLVIFVLRL